MSPEKQRIAIATACGWKCAGHPDQLAATGDFQFAYQFVINPNGEIVTHYSIPDYLNDLNACHEAEKVLTDEQTSAYITTLCLEVQPEPMLHHATAPQRCEAFLRTLGLWEEDGNEPRTEPADVATVIADPLADMRARAEAGDRHAQCTLGDAYAHGMEVAQDRVESDRWYAMFSAPLPTEDAQ